MFEMTSKTGAQPRKVTNVQPEPGKNAESVLVSRFTYNKTASISELKDAGALQTMLAKQFGKEEEHSETLTPPPAPSRLRQPLSPMWSRSLKTIAGLAILLTVGWMPMQRLFQVSSVEAVVNAQIVTIRAPIGGVIADGLEGLRVGSTIPAGWELATVANARADRDAVERATEELGAAREEQDALASRIARLAELRAGISKRVETFRIDRKNRVAAQIAEVDAEITGAEAVLSRVRAEFQRQSSLTASGTGARTARENAKRDLDVATAVMNQAKARKAALAVEAEALAQSRFFGNGYDDEPRSAQRLDDIAETMASLEADKARLDARVTRLQEGLTREKSQFELASNATLKAPTAGQVWELFTAPGEQVVAGQPLISVLDCSKLLVTAAVTEAVYNALSVGMPASFTFRDGARALPGKVVQLSGVSSAASNFAILPSALTKEAYRALVTVEGMQQEGSCPVGRTGRVVFGETAS
jgi:multidrug resistance efflux pump